MNLLDRATKWVAALILLGSSGLALAQAPQACIAPTTFIELTADVAGSSQDAAGKPLVPLGSYERFSPDGRFVLRSFSGAKLGQVSLMELPELGGTVVRAYATPLQNEAFPVQGSWRWLVNVNGDHYRLQDVLQQQTSARPQFRGGMTGFYAAASELPGDQPGQVKIRSLSWPNADGEESMSLGALSSRTLTVDLAQQRIVADSGRVYHCRDRAREDGAMYALPMISVDGTEYAAMPQNPVQGQPTMRIYGFGDDGKGCELRDTFAHASGKTIFGFSQGQPGGDLAYEYRGQAWWYSRTLQQAFNLATPPAHAGETLTASAFPGLTRDGRVIYASTLRQCDAQGQNCRQRVGYTVADPYQSAAVRAWRQRHPAQAKLLPACITQEQVRQLRAGFAAEHGLRP